MTGRRRNIDRPPKKIAGYAGLHGTYRRHPAVQGEGTNAERLTLDVVADRGCFNSAEILACDEAGITVTLPKPLTSGSKAKGR